MPAGAPFRYWRTRRCSEAPRSVGWRLGVAHHATGQCTGASMLTMAGTGSILLLAHPGRVQKMMRPDRVSSVITLPGGPSEAAPPVPIPNTEVKRLSADDTALARVWENRSLPGGISSSRDAGFRGNAPAAGLIGGAGGFIIRASEGRALWHSRWRRGLQAPYPREVAVCYNYVVP